MTPTKEQIEDAAKIAFTKYPNEFDYNEDFESNQYAFIAGAEWALSQSGWIPVEEGLPECNFDQHGVSIEMFPVWCKKRGYLASKIRKSNMQGNESVYFDDCLGYIPNITHYQPLPTQPKNELPKQQ